MVLTGKATSNICSSTMHLYKEELILPTRRKLTDLKGEKLDYFQNKYKNLKLVIIGELTMISHKMLQYIGK